MSRYRKAKAMGNPDRRILYRLQHMSDDAFMDWVFADSYKGLDGGLRAYAAVRWCKIRWPGDCPSIHRVEADTIFNAWDAL